MIYIYLFLLSVMTAILYRLGGASKEDQDKEFPWIPRWFKDIPKKRDVMANLVSLFSLSLIGITAPWWAWGLSFGLLWASLSSYWDWMFGYDNFFMHGIMCGISILPLVIWGNLSLSSFFVRAILMSLSIGLWSYYNGNATFEELGRGFFLTIFNFITNLF